MSKNNVVKLAGRDTIIDPLTELLRSGAEQLIYQAGGGRAAGAVGGARRATDRGWQDGCGA